MEKIIFILIVLTVDLKSSELLINLDLVKVSNYILNDVIVLFEVQKKTESENFRSQRQIQEKKNQKELYKAKF